MTPRHRAPERHRAALADLGPGGQPVTTRIRMPLCSLLVAAALAAGVASAASAKAMPNANRVPGTIAFSGGPVSGASAVSQIYEAHPDGSVRQLTHDKLGLVAAAWSPDGSRLVAFRFESPRTTALYIVRGDGSLGPRLTSAVDGEPRWSPDGRRVAYKLGRAIVVDFASGRGRRLIIQTGLPATAAPDVTWAPDGSRIAFAGAIRGRQGLFTATLPAGPGQAQVQLLVPLAGAFPGSPTWSPTGSQIAYARAGIWVVRADGSNPTRIAKSGFSPVWSPDGSHLALVTRHGNAVVNADGRRFRRLPGCTCTRDIYPGFNQRLSWSPDGAEVAYSGGVGPHLDGVIYRVRIDGRGGARVARSPLVTYDRPLWRPRVGS
ncbi:MAG: eukaryotic-like serine/threonine-protein kinase [Gaiellales bacterium]|nr:eukaryotic-like serine/threonine-protein kinase [Gaiellales bacterium]